MLLYWNALKSTFKIHGFAFFDKTLTSLWLPETLFINVPGNPIFSHFLHFVFFCFVFFQDWGLQLQFTLKVLLWLLKAPTNTKIGAIIFYWSDGQLRGQVNVPRFVFLERGF